MFNIKKNKKSKRGVVLQTVVPPEVNKTLIKVAKESGLHVSSLLRLIIMQHLKKDPPKIEDSESNLRSA